VDIFIAKNVKLDINPIVDNVRLNLKLDLIRM